MSEKYSIEQKTVENVLGIIRNGKIAIPRAWWGMFER